MTDEQKEKLARAYRDAFACQDACNLSGVAQSFARHFSAIFDESHEFGHGTDYVNRHPIVLWFLDKMNDLARRPDNDTLFRAHEVISAVTTGRVAIGSTEHDALVKRSMKL